MRVRRLGMAKEGCEFGWRWEERCSRRSSGGSVGSVARRNYRGAGGLAKLARIERDFGFMMSGWRIMRGRKQVAQHLMPDVVRDLLLVIFGMLGCWRKSRGSRRRERE